jgi:hypothetical protein
MANEGNRQQRRVECAHANSTRFPNVGWVFGLMLGIASLHLPYGYRGYGGVSGLNSKTSGGLAA